MATDFIKNKTQLPRKPNIFREYQIKGFNAYFDPLLRSFCIFVLFGNDQWLAFEFPEKPAEKLFKNEIQKITTRRVGFERGTPLFNRPNTFADWFNVEWDLVRVFERPHFFAFIPSYLHGNYTSGTTLPLYFQIDKQGNLGEISQGIN